MTEPQTQLKTRITESEKQAIASFSNDFMYAVTGMQMNDLQTRTIDPKQFALCLSSALYAMMKLKQEGKLDDVPDLNTEADFNSFAEAMARRYMGSVTSSAIGIANEALADYEPEKFRQLVQEATDKTEEELEILRQVNQELTGSQEIPPEYAFDDLEPYYDQPTHTPQNNSTQNTSDSSSQEG